MHIQNENIIQFNHNCVDAVSRWLLCRKPWQRVFIQNNNQVFSRFLLPLRIGFPKKHLLQFVIISWGANQEKTFQQKSTQKQSYLKVLKTKCNLTATLDQNVEVFGQRFGHYRITLKDNAWNGTCSCLVRFVYRRHSVYILSCRVITWKWKGVMVQRRPISSGCK